MKKEFRYQQGKKYTWQLQDAKAGFSELIRLVRSEGPQWVTLHGKEVAVILPVEQYERLIKHKTGGRNIVEFFAKSPLAGSGINLERQRDFGRDLDL